MVRYLSIFSIFLFVNAGSAFSQGGFKEVKKFNFFNRTELSYGFGINKTFLTEKLNAFQIKTVFGKQNEHVGAGIGIATTSFRSGGSNGGGNFNTISFSANLHYTLNNIFLKGSLGYAPKIFQSYDKGLNYDLATGYILKNKKGGKYFIEAIYLHQDFENFRNYNTIVKTESIGLGIGTWF